jgi:hypothetical protein
MRALVVPVMAATGLVMVAPHASAYSLEYNVATDPFFDPAWRPSCVTAGDGMGAGCYMAHGDQFEVSDFMPDGRSTGVQWKTDYGRYGLCRNKMGSRSYGFCNKDFAENHTITFRYGYCDGDVKDCTVPGSYTWTTGWHTTST